MATVRVNLDTNYVNLTTLLQMSEGTDYIFQNVGSGGSIVLVASTTVPTVANEGFVLDKTVFLTLTQGVEPIYARKFTEGGLTTVCVFDVTAPTPPPTEGLIGNVSGDFLIDNNSGSSLGSNNP